MRVYFCVSLHTGVFCGIVDGVLKMQIQIIKGFLFFFSAMQLVPVRIIHFPPNYLVIIFILFNQFACHLVFQEQRLPFVPFSYKVKMKFSS